jgi:hypothetical protein
MLVTFWLYHWAARGALREDERKSPASSGSQRAVPDGKGDVANLGTPGYASTSHRAIEFHSRERTILGIV